MFIRQGAGFFGRGDLGLPTPSTLREGPQGTSNTIPGMFRGSNLNRRWTGGHVVRGYAVRFCSALVAQVSGGGLRPGRLRTVLGYRSSRSPQVLTKDRGAC